MSKMKIRAEIKNIALDESAVIEKIVEIDENATLENLICELECGWADLSEYYEFSGVLTWNTDVLPYAIVGYKIVYDVPFSETKVSDFIKTHSIKNETFYITVGYPWAGGPGFITLLEMWDNAYPVLEQIAVLLTLGIAAKDVIKWFCHIFKKREQTPQVCFDIIFSRNQWNHFELAGLLDVPEEKAKELLKLFGYQYDRVQMQYIQGEQTLEIKQKLLSIETRDI